ncbi:hypothetical protein XaC1_365 [Xanthomonas phage XaC1]|nr:hypothetical protein XaC1_365 [Xanthomonas phage XaC1]
MANDFECRFCSKKFKREQTVLSHKCLKRDRYNEKDTRKMKVAYMMWKEYMQYHKFKIPAKVVQAGDEYLYFINSSVFNEFEKFAEYVTQNDIFKPDEFITHVIKSGINARDWCTFKVHQDWVIKYTRNEHPRSGIERSIRAFADWEALTGQPWNTFFSSATLVRVIMWFESGKLSPWIIYASNTADELLSRVSDSEYSHLIPYIDHTVWIPKISAYRTDVESIKQELKGFGL